MPYKDLRKRREAGREASERWRKKNPHYIRSWQKKNPDKVRAASGRYRKRHPNAWKRDHRKLMRDPIRLASKRKRARERQALRRLQQKLKIFEINLKSKYGLTLDQYNALKKKQRGRCAICRKKETAKPSKGRKKARGLSVDHCHKRKRVRGLLCSRCNAGLGQFLHSIRLLRLAICYMSR
jgi:hypothetical protein